MPSSGQFGKRGTTKSLKCRNNRWSRPLKTNLAIIWSWGQAQEEFRSIKLYDQMADWVACLGLGNRIHKSCYISL